MSAHRGPSATSIERRRRVLAALNGEVLTCAQLAVVVRSTPNTITSDIRALRKDGHHIDASAGLGGGYRLRRPKGAIWPTGQNQTGD